VKLVRKLPVWTYVLLNLAAFPGLGTILAGRRIGYLQAALMVVGFILSMGFLVFYLTCVAHYVAGANWTENEFKARYQPHLWALYWGLGACVVAWAWALASSWQIWQDRDRSPA